jgi:hypothetical protein
MVDRSDEMMMHYVQQVVDGLLARCDRMGMVCQIGVEIRRPDGQRVVHLDAHGKVEEKD